MDKIKIRPHWEEEDKQNKLLHKKSADVSWRWNVFSGVMDEESEGMFFSSSWTS